MVKAPRKINPDLNYIRFKHFVDGDIIATTDTGDWHFFKPEDFDLLVNGKLDKDGELYKELDDKNFFVNDDMLKRAYEQYQQRMAFTRSGPNLHIIITTLRCNYNCRYCHASRRPMSSDKHDMTPDTAKQVVDFIFKTPNPAVNIEFQGGEPLANWETVEFVIDYAREKNKTENKELAFSLVSNLSLMDDEKMEKLIAEDIFICTSVDGPRELHDLNRPANEGSSYDQTMHWMKRIEEAYAERNLDPKTHHVDVLLTVSRESLSQGKEIVDEYVAMGRNTLHLRPLNPFGFGKAAWNRIGYTTEEFNKFYNETLDYIIELNRRGVEIIERQAAIVLTRVLTNTDPNYMELRSPCGAAIGQLAYNYDGNIFTCDEARMIYEMGDDIFLLGHISDATYESVINHGTTKTMVIASTQDGLPGCADCVWKPYCGVCPVYNYSEQGDIIGQMPGNERCKLMMSQHEKFFSLLKHADDELLEIFKRWTTRRSRDDQGFFGSPQ